MRTIGFIALLTLVAQGQETRPANLVVHEWGTFTAVYGADGTRMEWRPLETSDLPSFVYSRTSVAAPLPDKFQGKQIRVQERMETPVLYFYTDKEINADVTVRFPKGLITEWYPRAKEFGPALGDGRTAVAVKDGMIHWGNFRVIPATAAMELPAEKAASHYYAARETDAAYVRVCPRDASQKNDEFEKFLFYRGVGNFPLPLDLKIHDGGRTTLINATRTTLGKLFLFNVRKDGSGSFTTVAALKGGESREVTLDPKGAAQPKAEFIQALTSQLESELIAAGLYVKEAKSMIKTWTDSYFEAEGTRILYLLPEAMTNELLPITITPAPRELKRVLVARVDLMTPEQSAELHKLLADLGNESLEQRDRAFQRIESFGRFAEPAIEEAIRTTQDAEIRSRAKELIDRLSVRR